MIYFFDQNQLRIRQKRSEIISVFLEGHRTWNLHIRDVQRTDAGAYMCQINTAKAKTRMGHLTVVGKSELNFVYVIHSNLALFALTLFGQIFIALVVFGGLYT